MLAFLNSGLGLLLVGAAVGALGLFTWQRRDWVFKQAYLRAEVMLDRRLNLIEAINTELGAFIANASSVIAGISKNFPQDQLDELVRLYNEEQAKWFASAPARAALLVFYFSPAVSNQFNDGLLKETQSLDVALYRTTVGDVQWQDAAATQESVQRHLQSWNALAVAEIQPT
jgi:hypothetical protein